MQESLINSLCAQSTGIHARWDALLRTERVTTPLAYPDSMIHLIDWALDQLFAALREPAVRRRAEHTGGRAVTRPNCPCGKNPLLAFFRAGEQAVLEALVLEQSAHRPIEPHERDSALNELCYAIRSMERREVEAFCSVCLHRHPSSWASTHESPAHGHGHPTHERADAEARPSPHSVGHREPGHPPRNPGTVS